MQGHHSGDTGIKDLRNPIAFVFRGLQHTTNVISGDSISITVLTVGFKEKRTN